MKKEIEYLQKTVANPVRPFVAILGGAKVSGKIGVIENLKNKCDKIIVGGAMAFTFIKARGQEVGASLVEPEMLEMAQKIRKSLRESNVKFYLPVDFVVAENMNDSAATKIVTSQEIPEGWVGLDIGPPRPASFPKRCRMPRPSYGTAPWACSKKTRIPAGPSRSPAPSPIPTRPRSWAGAIPMLPCTRPVFRTA